MHQNVAVEPITEYMTRLDGRPLCVSGQKDRVGPTAKRFLVEAQTGTIFEDDRIAKVHSTIQKTSKNLRVAINDFEADKGRRMGEPILLVNGRKRHSRMYASMRMCDTLDEWCTTALTQTDWFSQLRRTPYE